MPKFLTWSCSKMNDYLELYKTKTQVFVILIQVPVQQELAFNLSRLVRAISLDKDRVFLFLATFFTTIQREWAGIDKHRVDKYLSLIRRMLYEALRYCLPSAADSSGGSIGHIQHLSILLSKAVLSKPANGIRFHVCEIFVEEVCSAAPDIASEELLLALEPFFAMARSCSDRVLFERIVKDVFEVLLTRVLTQQQQQKLLPHQVDVIGPGVAEASSSDEVDLLEDAAGVAVDMAAIFQDQQFRALNVQRALLRVDLAPFAKKIFAVASDKATQVGNRARLFELHADYAAAARRLGHAVGDSQLYPLAALEHPDSNALVIEVPSGNKRRREGTVPIPSRVTSKAKRSISSMIGIGSAGADSLAAAKALVTPVIDKELLAIPSIAALINNSQIDLVAAQNRTRRMKGR